MSRSHLLLPCPRLSLSLPHLFGSAPPAIITCHPQTLLTGSRSSGLQPCQPHSPGTSRHLAGGQPLPDVGSHLEPVVTGPGHFIAPCGYLLGSRTLRLSPSTGLVTCVQRHGGCACSASSGSLGLAQFFFPSQSFHPGSSVAVGPRVSFVNNISQTYS